jgi:hypothetical protein
MESKTEGVSTQWLNLAASIATGVRIRRRDALTGFIRALPRVKEKLNVVPVQDHDIEGERSNAV